MKTKLIITLAILVAFIASCKLDEPILPGQPGYVRSFPPGGDTTGTGTGTGGTGTGAVTSGTYFIKGTLGSQAFDWVVTNDAIGWVMVSDNAAGSGWESGFINTAAPGGQAIDVQFINATTQAQGESDLTYFNDYIPTGTWAFATQADNVNTLIKSVYIFYYDADGNFYQNADVQTGTVTVTSVTPMAANNFFSNSLKVSLTISNCVLNPSGQSSTPLNPITLSNVSTTLMIEDIQ